MQDSHNSINTSKNKYKPNRNQKSFGSMIQLGDINSSKLYYQNASFKTRGSINNKRKKIQQKSQQFLKNIHLLIFRFKFNSVFHFSLHIIKF